MTPTQCIPLFSMSCSFLEESWGGIKIFPTAGERMRLRKAMPTDKSTSPKYSDREKPTPSCIAESYYSSTWLTAGQLQSKAD